ncbi:MAG: hypothetical protein VYB93_06185 [Pseudomonadota bacterium]|jgi:hypothetical protein|nr:hypothetical protein [Pseudomonadota bacterium]|tara:strand:- start:22715 stop:23338 length:624 start_codon:yes stop_codon:yes gene_type:complete
MCLIIYKPAGVAIAPDLLEAALSLNDEGFGVMGFQPDNSLLLKRSALISLDNLLRFEREHRDAEYVLHLRKRTKGDSGEHNTHPFKITRTLYLMHNGTIKVPIRVAGRSDSWHLAQDILRPLAQRRPGVLLDNAFIRLVEMALTPENKLVLMDYAERRIVILNQHHGAEFEGLWISNTRWIDSRILPLGVTPQRQERSHSPAHLTFI